jgi:hypothetical protein
LWSIRNDKPYSELAYTIGLTNLGRIGIFAGFKGAKQISSGIKISMPLLSIFNTK